MYVSEAWGVGMGWASDYVRDVSMSWFAALGLVGGGLVTRRWHTGEFPCLLPSLAVLCSATASLFPVSFFGKRALKESVVRFLSV